MQLVVSFVGMQTQIIKIGKKRSFSIRLKISDSDLDEVVVTGYQTMDKRESASAVSTIKWKGKDGRPLAVAVTTSSGRDEYKKIVDTLKQQWSKLGVNVLSLFFYHCIRYTR